MPCAARIRLGRAFAGLLLGAAAATAGAQAISISCGAVGRELEVCREGAEAWSRQTGVPVRVVSTPNSSSERLALYQQLLAARASDIDVFQIDVVWPGILGAHFIDLALHSAGAEQQHFPAIVANNTVGGRLVAMPWFTDVGVLYYRKDLLAKHGAEVPPTWQALTETAARIQAAERAAGQERMWGFVWQGKAYGGLSCNALEWIDSFGGGTVVDARGRITIDNPQARAALALAAGWVDTISPPGVLNYGEEEARGLFQSGAAVFMRNWPYAWALAQSADSPVRGKVGVAPLPRGGDAGKRSGTLGGWQLAVSRYSKRPREAAALVMYLSARAEQKRRALAAAFNPTIVALYDDAETVAALPIAGELRATLEAAVARPSQVTGARYNRVSAEFWGAVHGVLAGRATPDAALARLQGELARVRRARW